MSRAEREAKYKLMIEQDENERKEEAKK